MQTPEAIQSITREEEQWETYRFEELVTAGRTFHVARMDEGYFMKQKPGTQLEELDRFADIEPRQLTRREALEKRSQFDPAWRNRPKMLSAANMLWHAKKFIELESGDVTAFVDLHGLSNQASSCSAAISRDGAISVEIEKPSMYDKKAGIDHPMSWHEYELPRSEPYVYHRVKREAEAQPLERKIIGSATVARQVQDWLDLMAKVATADL